MMSQQTVVAPRLTHLQRWSFGIGVLASVLTGVGAFLSPAQFFPAYLVAYMFVLGLTLGCLALTMLHHLAGGTWGTVILRLLEAGMSALPLMVVLFVPIIFGLLYLYPWAHMDEVARDSLLRQQYPYLNIPFFLIRVALYFAIWIVMAHILRRWSLQRDQATDPLQFTNRLKRFSSMGLVGFVLTTTFAMIDWVMSLEPHWYSTVYAAMVMMGAVLSAFAFVIVIRVWLNEQMPKSNIITPDVFNDLGSLLLAFVMLWAYLGFSQFLIIYSGNLTQEIPWYAHRLQGGWEWIALAVALLNFVLPFAFLLFRDLKRYARLLAVVAALLVIARIVDVFWLIQPAFTPSQFSIHWLHFTALFGVGALWFAVFARALGAYPLLPTHDSHAIDLKMRALSERAVKEG